MTGRLIKYKKSKNEKKLSTGREKESKRKAGYRVRIVLPWSHMTQSHRGLQAQYSHIWRLHYNKKKNLPPLSLTISNNTLGSWVFLYVTAYSCCACVCLGNKMTVLPESTQAVKAAPSKSKSQSLDKSVFLHAGCSHLILISYLADWTSTEKDEWIWLDRRWFERRSRMFFFHILNSVTEKFASIFTLIFSFSSFLIVDVTTSWTIQSLLFLCRVGERKG